MLDPFCGCGTAVAGGAQAGAAVAGNRHNTPGRGADEEPAPDGFRAGSGPGLRRHRRAAGRGERPGAVGAGSVPVPVLGGVAARSAAAVGTKARGRPGRGWDAVLHRRAAPYAAQGGDPRSRAGGCRRPQGRDLVGVVEREQAALGLFISLEPPTRDMRQEAASAGFFHSDLWAREFPKVQLRTVGEMLSGNGFELPPRPAEYQPAQRVRRPQGRQGRLGEPS